MQRPSLHTPHHVEGITPLTSQAPLRPLVFPRLPEWCRPTPTGPLLIELSQVVEIHFGSRRRAYSPSHFLVIAEIAQQTEADPTIRNAQHLRLNNTQRLARLGRAANVQQHWIDARKPAHRPREVHAIQDVFAPVPFHIHEQPRLPRPALPRLGERRQQEFLYSRARGRRRPPQQRPRLLHTERGRHHLGRSLTVDA